MVRAAKILGALALILGCVSGAVTFKLRELPALQQKAGLTDPCTLMPPSPLDRLAVQRAADVADVEGFPDCKAWTGIAVDEQKPTAWQSASAFEDSKRRLEDLSSKAANFSRESDFQRALLLVGVGGVLGAAAVGAFGGLVLLCLIWLLWKAERSASAAETVADRFQTRLSDECRNWPDRYVNSTGRASEVIGFDPAGKNIRVFKLAKGNGTPTLLSNFQASIASVESVRVDRTEVVTRSQVVTTKRKNPLVRAAVGGVLLGPAGAVIGAISSKTEATITDHEKVTYGPPTLVITTNDIEARTARFVFDTLENAKRWRTKIQIAAARNASLKAAATDPQAM